MKEYILDLSRHPRKFTKEHAAKAAKDLERRLAKRAEAKRKAAERFK